MKDHDPYPRGKLSDDDEGATGVAVTVKDKTVIVAFPEPMKWIGMDKDTAILFAQTILRRASEIV